MLLSKNFLLLYAMNAMSIFSGFFVLNQTKVYGMENGLTNDKNLALIASIGSIFNALRWVWSWMLDYYNYKQVYGILLVSQIFLNFTITFVSKNTWLYGVWIILFMFCEGGHFTLVPNMLKLIYGSSATQLYGVFFSYISLCAVCMIMLQNAFLVSDEIDTFNLFFKLNGVLSAISLFLLFAFFK